MTTGGSGSTPGVSHEAPVIEYLVRTRRTWGQRVFANGDCDEWIDGRGWERLITLSAEDIEALLSLARENGFFELPAEVGDAVDADDAMTSTWTIESRGARKSVTLRGAAEPASVLRSLNDELQLIVGRALNREADAGGD